MRITQHDHDSWCGLIEYCDGIGLSITQIISNRKCLRAHDNLSAFSKLNNYLFQTLIVLFYTIDAGTILGCLRDNHMVNKDIIFGFF